MKIVNEIKLILLSYFAFKTKVEKDGNLNKAAGFDVPFAYFLENKAGYTGSKKSNFC